jgi:YVTN family beta-propeller protein
MPPVLDPKDIYSADRPNRLSAAVRNFPALVYVPNSNSNTVDVIDQRTYKVIAHYSVGRLPQHVTPSWDLKTLYATNDLGNTLTAFNPATGKPGPTFQVDDPYNLYFTPDGKFAIVVAERLRRLDFRDAHTMKLVHTLHVDCKGVDHADFTADGRFGLFSCEFSGKLVKVDIARQRAVSYLTLAPNAMPQDVKTSPDGSVFYIADMAANGVWLVDAVHMKKLGFLPTGKNAHGLYVSRDSRYLYVSNRGEGSISLIDLRTRRVAKKWRLPGGGSPDMGGVSADGKILWLSGRYNSVVYAISTVTGKLIARIPVGGGPHGLCVYPQPGRYSLGHTGVFR